MAFTLTHYETSEAVEYMPDIDDNRERDDPFTVLILPAKAADARKLDERHGRHKHGKTINYIVKHHNLRTELLTKYVKGVQGLNVKDDMGVSPVTTVEHLLAVASDPLLDEIAEAIRDHSKLDEGAKKQ